MNAADVLRALVRTKFPPRRYAVCPNVSWALLPWEADVVCVSGSGISHEIEIKVTASDLWRDQWKRKWAGEGPWAYVNYFWYAVPASLQDLARNRARQVVGAGVLVVDDTGNVSEFHKAIRSRRVKSDAVTAAAVHRLAGLRYWDTVLKGVK